MSKLSTAFQRFAEVTARYSGKPATFLAALAIIVVWGVTGPLFGFNDTWQLVINTGTTIITFLMVFLIQNSQNRESAALQIKLDELIHVTEARNSLLDLENVDEETLDRLREDYRKLAQRKDEREQAGSGPGNARGSSRKRKGQAGGLHSGARAEPCAEDRDIDQELEQAHARQEVIEQARKLKKRKRTGPDADPAR